MPGINTFDDLFLSHLKDIYYAERQVLKVLPKMVKAAQNPELKEAFTLHREQTQGQIERLQSVFEMLGKRAAGVKCEAMDGLVEECDELLEEAKEPSAIRDAGLLASAQAVEHYEMARYGTLIAWAKANGKKDIVALLQQTLDEEKKTDLLLSQMGQKTINKAAVAAE
ncbi:MAG: ferritin-like domain-containing protein [Pseudomonadota bacterium]